MASEENRITDEIRPARHRVAGAGIHAGDGAGVGYQKSEGEER